MDGPVKEMSREDLAASVGTSLGASEWFLIDQKTIDGFADLTQDHYFIHIDPDRAKAQRVRRHDCARVFDHVDACADGLSGVPGGERLEDQRQLRFQPLALR